MKTIFRHQLLALALGCAAVAPLSAWAADPITDAVQAAYPPYRMALFKTNGSSQAESRAALVAAQSAWRELSQRFGPAPTPPYAGDTQFGATLAEVDKVYAKALTEIDAGQLKDAHNTLEHARDLMAELRQRNQVVVFSDHMNAYHEAMEHLLDDGAAVLAQPQGLARLTAQSGVLSYLAQRLKTQASPALLANAEFTTLLQAVQQSVQALEKAVLAQDAPAAREALTKLKGPYSRLFAKFG